MVQKYDKKVKQPHYRRKFRVLGGNSVSKFWFMGEIEEQRNERKAPSNSSKGENT